MEASSFLNRFYWFGVVGLCTLGVDQLGRAYLWGGASAFGTCVCFSICSTRFGVVGLLQYIYGVDWSRGWGQSPMGICAFFYMGNLFGVVVFQRSMVDWRRGWGSVCHGYMCILLYVKLIQCSGFPEIYP